MHDSQNLHVIANIKIWICIELLMAIKGVSDYVSNVGGVTGAFVMIRFSALVYWIIAFGMLRKFPAQVTKTLVFYHVILSLSMIVLSRGMCVLKDGPMRAYEMITRSYLLLYLVIMQLLNSNYVFT